MVLSAADLLLSTICRRSRVMNVTIDRLISRHLLLGKMAADDILLLILLDFVLCYRMQHESVLLLSGLETLELNVRHRLRNLFSLFGYSHSLILQVLQMFLTHFASLNLSWRGR